MSSPRSIEQAKQAITLHIDRQLGHMPPTDGAARQILHRPFPSSGDRHIILADQVLYSNRDGQQLRMSLILESILARDDLDLLLEDSVYTTYGDESIKESLGGLDSAIAFAVAFGGISAWLTVTNYHLYETKNGVDQVARILGRKVLGPSMILTRRPAHAMPAGHNAAKHFPDTQVGAEFVWTPITDVHPEILELETGLDITRLQSR